MSDEEPKKFPKTIDGKTAWYVRTYRLLQDETGSELATDRVAVRLVPEDDES
jgi:hypothetical protein